MKNALRLTKLALIFSYYFYFYALIYLHWDPRFLNVFIFSLLALSVPAFSFDLKKNNKLSFWFFFYPLLYFSFSINVGFDMTDELFAIHTSYFFEKNSNIVEINPVSYYLTHWFYVILGKPYVLLTRILRITLVALTLMFSYLIIREVEQNSHTESQTDHITVIALILSAAGISVLYVKFFIPHDHIPVFLAAVSFWLWVKYQYTKKAYWIFMLGLLITIMIYSRFGSVIYILPLVIIAFISYKKMSIRDLLAFSAGLLSALLFFFTLGIDIISPLKFWKVTNLENNCVSITHDHNFKQMLDLYILETKQMLKFIIGALIYISSIDLLSNKLKKRNNQLAYYLLSLITVIIAVIAFWRFRYPNYIFVSRYFNWFYLVFGLTIAFWIYNIVKNKKLNINHVAFIFIIILISFLGSNGGYRKIAYSGGALGFLIIYIFSTYKNTIFKPLYYTILILIFAIGLNFIIFKRYRDYTDSYRTSKFFEQPVLYGIRTSPMKVKNIDVFYKRIQRYDIRDSNYTLINKPFVFPLLLDKKPAFTCWLTDPDKLLKQIQTDEKLEYVIMSNVSMRLNNWDAPKRKNYLAIERDLPVIRNSKRILDSLFKPVTYSKDSIFVLYKRR